MFSDKVMIDFASDDLTKMSEPSPSTALSFLDLLAAPFSPRSPTRFNKLTSFHLFSALPSEIRQHIFRLSLPSRVLTVTYDAQNHRFNSSTSPPTLLRVSHEARISALQVYSLSLGTHVSQPRIYFNPYLDTLYLPRHGDMGYDENFRDFKNLVTGTSGLTNELRRVAIDHVDLDIKRPWESYNKASFIRGFKSLQEIVLVYDSNTEDQMTLPTHEVSRFVAPNLGPEQQLRMWWYFQQGFATEEKVLAEVCAEFGHNYEAFTLPRVQICGKEVSTESY